MQQHVQDGRGCQAVAFELYDGELREVGVVLGNQVVEPEVDIDGESLGESVVHQRDAVEVVLERLPDRLRLIAQVLVEEVAVIVALLEGDGPLSGLFDHVGSEFNTFFARALVIILCFDFEKTQSGCDVGPDAKFLAICMSVLVCDVHVEVVSVKVGRIVRNDALLSRFLNVILFACEFQQQHES